MPVNTGQWQVVEGWNNAGSMVASPDYFHYDAPSASDLPETPLALVEAYEGDAVMGWIACGRRGTNLREYLTAEFSSPLQLGKRYRIRIRLTNGAKTDVSTSGLGVRGIGIHLSNSQPVQDAQLPLELAPQFVIDELLYDEEWRTFTFSFTADQPYLFMTIGVFGGDEDKEIEALAGPDPLYAYYFIDGVTLVEIPGDLIPVERPGEKEEPGRPGDGAFVPQPIFVPNSFTPDGDGHNDVFLPVAGTVGQWKLSVYNGWGERVFFTEDSSHGWNGTFNGKKADNGSYVWEITYFTDSADIGLVEHEERGIVTLIR